MRGRPTASSPSLTSASMVGQMKHMPTLNSPVASTSPETQGERPADGQRSDHHAEADLERVEIAAPLPKPAALPCGKDINQAIERRKREIIPAIEAELVPHEKIDVIGIKRHREGTQSFHGETKGFELAAARGHDALLEISRMAARQYHFTASDIGGSSLSKSAAEHQRMS